MGDKKISNKAILSLLKISKNPDTMSDLLRVVSDKAILSIIVICANLIHNKKFNEKVPPLKLKRLKNTMKKDENKWLSITSKKNPQ